MTKTEFDQVQANVRLAAIADRAYETIARAFPVCSASDEFYFFPQVHKENCEWSCWDDFSARNIDDCLAKLHACEIELGGLSGQALPAGAQTDLGLLAQTLRTLREQLLIIAPHRHQPTYHLTIIASGLAEALMCGDPRAWPQRVAGLQDFVVRAESCLENVPDDFMSLGLAMLEDLRAWLSGLDSGKLDTAAVAAAFDRFQDTLERVPVCADVFLSEEALTALVGDHLGCAMGIDTVMTELAEEYREMEDVLQQEASRLTGCSKWHEALTQIPFRAAPDRDLSALYQQELRQLERHCRDVNLLPDFVPQTVPLDVQPVPDYLMAVRASDAYAARPGHPPRGGTFYVFEKGHARRGVVGRSLEFRQTAVHEAWPGHHLLDCARWSSPHVLRRPIEQPLFYEGWACLAEELMVRSGYLDDAWDRFLVAKRRLERAARGMVDIGLQSGRLTKSQAVERLVQAGFDRHTAQRVVPKYLLRPGYQLCYTIGLRQALGLFDQYGQADPGRFVRTVLSEAEIGYSRLGEILKTDAA